MAAKRKPPRLSTVEKAVIQAEGLREYLPKNQLPIFNHLLKEARDAIAARDTKRASRHIAHGKRIARDALKQKYRVQQFENGKWKSIGEVETNRAAALMRRDKNYELGGLFRVLDHAGHVVEPQSDREFKSDEKK